VLFKIFVETIILFKDKFKDKKNESYVKSFIMEFIHFRLLFYDFVPFFMLPYLTCLILLKCKIFRVSSVLIRSSGCRLFSIKIYYVMYLGIKICLGVPYKQCLIQWKIQHRLLDTILLKINTFTFLSYLETYLLSFNY